MTWLNNLFCCCKNQITPVPYFDHLVSYSLITFCHDKGSREDAKNMLGYGDRWSYEQQRGQVGEGWLNEQGALVLSS